MNRATASQLSIGIRVVRRSVANALFGALSELSEKLSDVRLVFAPVQALSEQYAPTGHRRAPAVELNANVLAPRPNVQARRNRYRLV